MICTGKHLATNFSTISPSVDSSNRQSEGRWPMLLSSEFDHEGHVFDVNWTLKFSKNISHSKTGLHLRSPLVFAVESLILLAPPQVISGQCKPLSEGSQRQVLPMRTDSVGWIVPQLVRSVQIDPHSPTLQFVQGNSTKQLTTLASFVASVIKYQQIIQERKVFGLQLQRRINSIRLTEAWGCPITLYQHAQKWRGNMKQGQTWKFPSWAPCDIISPARLHLLNVPWPSQRAPAAGDQMFKHTMRDILLS